MNSVEVKGSVRVDLLGGTLDLNPINLIIPNIVTINLATSLKAVAKISSIEKNGLEIISKDYSSTNFFSFEDITESNINSSFFGPLSFVVQIVNIFKPNHGLRIELESGSPPGAGLGGSSAMGVTLYKALSQFFNLPFDEMTSFKKVNSIEAKILDSGPAGYQDYFPALYGGILALTPELGDINVEQLYSIELKKYLESNLTLVYSGETRHSGFTNWEVYKGFFDKDVMIRKGLTRIAELSYQAYEAIKRKDFSGLSDLISLEGSCRKELFPSILSPNMKNLYNEIKTEVPELGIKVCGAGGGGCFLLVHSEDSRQDVQKLVNEKGMKVLDFKIEAPL